MRGRDGPFLVAVLVCALFACKQRAAPSGQSSSTASASTAVPARPSAAAQPESARGTPAEAKAMLEKAGEHYEAVGRTQAFADFNARKPPFFDRDLYVACVDSKHVTMANGGYPHLVGSSVDSWKDADGKPLGKAFDEAIKATGQGSVEYRWLNPVSQQYEPKIGFAQKLGTDSCIVGAYNPH